MNHRRIALTALFCLSAVVSAQEPFSVEAPPLVLKGIPFDLLIAAEGQDLTLIADGDTLSHGDVSPAPEGLRVSDVILSVTGSHELHVVLDGVVAKTAVYSLPGLVSILPPLLAIALAIMTRQVILSLFAGIWIGAVFTLGGSLNPISGLLKTMDTVLIRALSDPDHASIILFTLILGGMVGIISRSGGTEGIVAAISSRLSTRRSGQMGTWMMGLLIFFDDYSNSLLVGNTMRPLTDKLKISREKLSYVVDSTSAPLASIALASTWIGYELGLINSSFDSMGIDQSAYGTFLMAIPYSFYSLMALVMVPIIALSGRDYGPMLAAERRALTEGKVLRDGAKPLLDEELSALMAPEGVQGHWVTAAAPIMAMLIMLAGGLYVDGMRALGPGDYLWRDIVGAANSFVVLIWASTAGAAVAGMTAMAGRMLNLGQTVDAFIVGLKAMVVGVIILTLARGLQIITSDLQTADYIFHLTADLFDPRLLPAVTFITAALISFSTGTSYGTMAILIPVVLPLAFNMPGGGSVESPILLGSLGAILSGAIFGDHCSPISDTTVLSSIASGADHIDHVRTQLPYGLTVAGVTLAVGYLPAGFGWNPWIGNLLALGLLIGIVLKLGHKTEEAA